MTVATGMVSEIDPHSRVTVGRLRRPRVVVAGQLPPPLSGQHIAVQGVLTDLEADGRFEVVHLPYRFSKAMEQQGRFSLAKLLELPRALLRLLRVRAGGPIDLLLYPISGTSLGATVRDLVLLPPAYLLSRGTVVQFHGAGQRRWVDDQRCVVRLAQKVLGRADAAIVHAEANTVDPETLGIGRVFVVPYRVDDVFDPARLRRHDLARHTRFLYVGHLGPHRGTPALLDAMASLAKEQPTVQLELVGSPVGSFSVAEFEGQIAALGLTDRVRWLGPLDGVPKLDAFGRADLFVFPSVFDAESFGLVLVEALMWGLPIVATDWRANREVLTGADAIIHDHEPELAASVTDALSRAITLLRSGGWPPFSERNRALFEERYRRREGPCLLGDALATMLHDDPATPLIERHEN